MLVPVAGALVWLVRFPLRTSDPPNVRHALLGLEVAIVVSWVAILVDDFGGSLFEPTAVGATIITGT